MINMQVNIMTKNWLLKKCYLVVEWLPRSRVQSGVISNSNCRLQAALPIVPQCAVARGPSCRL